MLLRIGEAHRLDCLMRDRLFVLVPGFHFHLLQLCISLVCSFICTVLHDPELANVTLFHKLDPVRRCGAIRGAQGRREVLVEGLLVRTLVEANRERSAHSRLWIRVAFVVGARFAERVGFLFKPNLQLREVTG